MSFREDLRNKLMSATQHGRPVKDFAKDLENLAVRYDDVDPLTIRRIFWDGVDDFIRLYWIDKGLSLEFSNIQTLVYYAYRVEKREYEKKRMERRRADRSTDTRGGRSGAAWGRKTYASTSGTNSGVRRSTANGQRPPRVVRSAASRPAGDENKTDPGAGSHKNLTVGARLNAKQMAEHRAQGLCFNCHEGGHETRSCPQRQDGGRVSSRAVAIDSEKGSQSRKGTPQKARVRRQLKTLPSAAVRVMITTPFAALRNNVLAVERLVNSPAHAAAAWDVFEQQLVLRALSAFCEFFSPYTAWLEHFSSPEQRFAVVAYGHPCAPDVAPGYIAVFDRVNGIEFVVPAGAFSADELDVAHVVLQRLGLGLVLGQDLVRADVQTLSTRVKGRALTWIDGGWASVSTLADAVELGLRWSDRFVVQTNGVDLVVLDQAYGLAFLVTSGELYEGIAVADLLRKTQLTDWNGQLIGAHPPSTRIYASDDWVSSVFESDPGFHRYSQWESYFAFYSAYTPVAKKDKRTLEDLRIAQLAPSPTSLFGAELVDWSFAVPESESGSDDVAANAVEELDAIIHERLGRALDEYPTKHLDATSVEVSVTEAEGAPEDLVSTTNVVVVQVDATDGEATVQVAVTPPRYSRLQPASPEEISVLEALALEEYEPAAPAYRVENVHGADVGGGESDSTGSYSDLPDLLSVSSTTSSSSATGLSTHYAGVPLFPIVEEYEPSTGDSSLGRSSDSGPAVLFERERRLYGLGTRPNETRLERMQRLADEERELRRSYFERAVERVQGWRRSLSRSSGSSA
ncbi:hypothetical protein EXIGLDRAFT_772194 [Exidia glandulosa HHB12029]|uniref:CCHC-type domain-containing protein n=1 Tax=Exidia glandulosa HHB12029 TaxID=1314781 RepID=A0A165FGW1_EXIGL|nr:hypothetical protein EXIGLDRAFT_772194 [Exidia glandulosa HHB12029]